MIRIAIHHLASSSSAAPKIASTVLRQATMAVTARYAVSSIYTCSRQVARTNLMGANVVPQKKYFSTDHTFDENYWSEKLSDVKVDKQQTDDTEQFVKDHSFDLNELEEKIAKVKKETKPHLEAVDEVIAPTVNTVSETGTSNKDAQDSDSNAFVSDHTFDPNEVKVVHLEKGDAAALDRQVSDEETFVRDHSFDVNEGAKNAA